MASPLKATDHPGRRSTLHRLRLGVALMAWFLAAGSHWELVQGFAWTKMFVGYLQDDYSVGEALEMTFDPDNACSLCELVEQVRDDAPERETPDGKAKAKTPGKEPLFCQAEADFRFRVPASEWWSAHPLMPEPLPATPPTPPPRGASLA